MNEAPLPGAVVALCAQALQAFWAADMDAAARAYAEAVRRWEEAGRPERPDGQAGSTLYECLGLAQLNRRRCGAAAGCFLRALQGPGQGREQSLRFLVTALIRLGHLGHATRRLAAYQRLHGEHPDGWTAEGLADLHATLKARRARRLPG